MGSLTATVALLAGMTGAHAQGAPGAGSYPGSFLIPGTNTSFSVGGYVKADYNYDFSAMSSVVGGVGGGFGIPLDAGFFNGANQSASAGHNQHGRSSMTASESRFNIQTRTPTAYGEVKTFIEGDFTNPNGLSNTATFTSESNSSGFRLRQAYGTLGPVLAGQTFSAFNDLNAESETLDFGGDNYPGTLRVPQFRYTYDAGSGISLIGSAENPQTVWVDATGGTNSGTSFGTGQGNKIPDFVMRGEFTQPWGHISLRSAFRDLYDHNGSNVSTGQFGYALALGGDLKTWGKDDVLGQVFGGDGIGRYLSNNCGCNDMSVNYANGTSETIPAWGVHGAYQHWWADNLRSNVGGSYLEFLNPSIETAAVSSVQNKRIYTMHVNLIWSPVPNVDTGIEYMWEKREIQSGQNGDLNRLQVSTKFKF